MTQPREELPQPPATGAPACGPTSGARLLLALEPQEECWIKEFKEYLMQGTLSEKEEDAERLRSGHRLGLPWLEAVGAPPEAELCLKAVV